MAIFLKNKKALRRVMSILKFHFLFSASMKPHKRRGWRQTFQFISLVLRAATEHYFEVAVCPVHLSIKRKIEKRPHYESNYMSEKFVKKYRAYN